MGKKARAQRKVYRSLKIAGIVLAVLVVFYVGGAVIGARLAMVIPRLPVEASAYPTTLGLSYEEVSFASRTDNGGLKGWFLPAKGDYSFLIVDGGFQNRVDATANTLGLARDLVAGGYNVLLFDLRGRGESAGQGLSLSNIDKDIGGAFDYVKSRGFSASHVYILGFCSGAASACLFAADNEVGGLVLDGVFASVQGMVINQARQRHIPIFLVDAFIPALVKTAGMMYSFELVNTIDVIEQVKCPVFFIHEQNDDLITLSEMQQLYEKAPNSVNQFWEIPNSLHSEGYTSHPVEYMQHLNAFLATIKP